MGPDYSGMRVDHKLEKTNELLFDVLPKILETQTEILEQLKALNYRIDKLERADRSKEDGLN